MYALVICSDVSACKTVSCSCKYSRALRKHSTAEKGGLKPSAFKKTAATDNNSVALWRTISLTIVHHEGPICLLALANGRS
eukprot:2677-Heterococcus_DN1.PRE.3